MNELTHKKYIGILAALISEIAYGTNPLFTLPLYKDGFTPDSVLLFRYLFSALLLAAIIKIRGERLLVTAKELRFLIPAGFLFAFSSLTLFVSYQKMDAGIASTILFIYPLLTVLIMAILFKEKTGIATWGALLLSSAGILLLYQKSDGSFLSTAGVVLVLISALLYAAYMIWLDKTILNSMSAWKVTFYVLSTGILLYSVRLLAGCGTIGTFTKTACLNFTGLVLIATVLSLVCTSLAIQMTGASTTALLGAMEPLTAVIIGVTVFGEEMNLRIALGILLILCSVILIVLCRKSAPREKTETC